MGEIKSTLDIIMEKTKNLTVTEEEKRAFKEQQVAGKVKGLLQRYADGLINRQRLMEEVADLERESGDKEMVGDLFLKESVGHMQLGRDNEPFLGILEMVPGANAPAVRELLEAYEIRVVHQKEAAREKLKARLRDLGISGSAVLPNLEADQEWKEDREGLEREMKMKLSQMMGK